MTKKRLKRLITLNEYLLSKIDNRHPDYEKEMTKICYKIQILKDENN